MNIDLSQKARELKIGRYRHFKGGEYEVIGVALDADDHTKELVIYRSLADGMLWVRPLVEFTEEVNTLDNNYRGSRFIYLGQ